MSGHAVGDSLHAPSNMCSEAQHLNNKPVFDPVDVEFTARGPGHQVVRPSQHIQHFPSLPHGSPRDTLFGLSLEQLKCPVVIEVFSGSARVTAALRAVGIKSSFGVDHDVSKAVAAVKQLDLTTHHGQQILLTWLKSPMVVGVFIALPCGTCSLARCIQLRDSRGRPLPGPRPLRSSSFPEGLRGLSISECRRVSQANMLYASSSSQKQTHWAS